MPNTLPITEDTLASALNISEPKARKSNDNQVAKQDSRPSNEVTSLSFDQVNDDADELIELRGEGRYFGVTDPSSGDTINAQQSLGPLCGNCHKRGHVRAKCKTVVCHKCGVVGDHYETQCPTTIKCAKCGEKGHIASNCKSKTRKRTYCKSCDTFNHDDLSCPNIWRSYITKGSEKHAEESLVLPRIYCYNCASQYHYGDECNETRISRVPNFGSAFSGSNLPKKLRPLYFHRLKSTELRSNLHNIKPTKSGQLQPKKFDNFNNYGKSNDRRNFGSRDFSNKNFNNNSGNNNNNRNFSNNSLGGHNIRTANGSGNIPSRSGMMKARPNSGKNTTTNYAGISKPTRSGFLEETSGKKKKFKNMRNLY